VPLLTSRAIPSFLFSETHPLLSQLTCLKGYRIKKIVQILAVLFIKEDIIVSFLKN